MRGTCDVWHAGKRYVFAARRGGYVTDYKQSIAKYILGDKGRAADLTGTYPAYGIGAAVPADAIHTTRKPDGAPLHSAAGLVLVNRLLPGDARRKGGLPRGCVLALDKQTDIVYLYKRDGHALGGWWRERLIQAFTLNSGPPVQVSGRFPVYVVDARPWSELEKGARVSGGLRAYWAARKQEEARRERQEEARVSDEARAIDVKARAIIKARAIECDRVRRALRSARVSLARWPDEKRAGKVAGLEAEYISAVAVYEEDRARAIDGVRGTRAVAAPKPLLSGTEAAERAREEARGQIEALEAQGVAGALLEVWRAYEVVIGKPGQRAAKRAVELERAKARAKVT